MAGSPCIDRFDSDGRFVCSVRVASAKRPLASVTRTVKVLVPEVVGVPLRTPSELRDRPAGNEPEVTLQVNGGVPLEADRVCEYAVPTVPDGSVVVSSVGGVATTIVTGTVALAPFRSCT